MFLLIIMEKYMTNRDVSLLAFRIFNIEEMRIFSENTMVFNEETGEFLNLKEYIYEGVRNNKFKSIRGLLNEIFKYIPEESVSFENGQCFNPRDICCDEANKIIQERNRRMQAMYVKGVVALEDLNLLSLEQNQQQGQTVIPPRPNAPSVAPLPVWW